VDGSPERVPRTAGASGSDGQSRDALPDSGREGAARSCRDGRDPERDRSARRETTERGARNPNANPDFTPPNVFKLAEETGGEVFRADKAGERFIEMMERVRLRYDLAIRPQTGPQALFRHLEVRLSEAARETARQGGNQREDGLLHACAGTVEVLV